MEGSADPGRETPIDGLVDLPIEVAEAMYSPDFVELVSLSAGGMPLVLPMSFTLDIAGNAVRFSSPVAAGRLANLARDPRCCVSFSRVTSGHPAVLMQGTATLGEVAEGVRRGPARRFTVAPYRLIVLEQPPRTWRFPDGLSAAGSSAEGIVPPVTRGGAVAPATEDDLTAITGFETMVLGLRDADGWPLSLPVEPRREGAALLVSLPDCSLALGDGPASLLGHTWTKEGPRYLALTGSSRFKVPRSKGSGYNVERGTLNLELAFRPVRAMRRS